MKIKGSIKYKKGIVIDERKLNEIQQLMLGYCDIIRYSAELENDTKIDFDNYDELIQYENYNKKKIKKLNMWGIKDNSSFKIDIDIGGRYAFVMKYTYSLICYYTFNTLDDENLFRSKLKNILDKSVSNYWVFSKISVPNIIILLYLYYTFFYAMPNMISGNLDFPLISIFSWVLVVGVGFIGAMFMRAFDESLWSKLFPSVTFKLGEEIENYEKLSKWRAGIFWTVIMGGTISLITGIILNVL